MSLEIERKFLVIGDFKPFISSSYRIKQGYFTLKGPTVRIRIKGEKGYITIKGKSTNGGLSRYEWEKEISVEEANELLELCDERMVDKTRYEVVYKNQTFEVDEFYGLNQGLVIAELELETENQAIDKPDWLGKEVTGEKKYYNSKLCKNPYLIWDNEG